MDYKIDQIEKHNDPRGQLVVFIKNRELPKKYKEFGQIYFVTFEGQGVVRGNHYHKKWREWFGIVEGKLEVILKDVRTGKVKKMILSSASKKYTRLEVGPYIAHAFKNLSDTAALLNYTNTEWSKKDDFEEILITT